MKKLNETEGVKMEKALEEKTGGYLIGDAVSYTHLTDTSFIEKHFPDYVR